MEGAFSPPHTHTHLFVADNAPPFFSTCQRPNKTPCVKFSTPGMSGQDQKGVRSFEAVLWPQCLSDWLQTFSVS